MISPPLKPSLSPSLSTLSPVLSPIPKNHFLWPFTGDKQSGQEDSGKDEVKNTLTFTFHICYSIQRCDIWTVYVYLDAPSREHEQIIRHCVCFFHCVRGFFQTIWVCFTFLSPLAAGEIDYLITVYGYSIAGTVFGILQGSGLDQNLQKEWDSLGQSQVGPP